MECDHLYCGDCIHFGHEIVGTPCTKRIDHVKIRFAKPFFKCYDCHQHSGIPCSDFSPKPSCVYTYEHWEGWKKYWKDYVETWLPYKDTDIFVWFTLGKNTDVRYGVKLLDWVNGTMYDGNKLKATKKQYIKQTRKDDFGYKVVTEDIEGVEIE